MGRVTRQSLSGLCANVSGACRAHGEARAQCLFGIVALYCRSANVEGRLCDLPRSWRGAACSINPWRGGGSLAVILFQHSLRTTCASFSVNDDAGLCSVGCLFWSTLLLNFAYDFLPS